MAKSRPTPHYAGPTQLSDFARRTVSFFETSRGSNGEVFVISEPRLDADRRVVGFLVSKKYHNKTSKREKDRPLVRYEQIIPVDAKHSDDELMAGVFDSVRCELGRYGLGVSVGDGIMRLTRHTIANY